MPDTPQTTAYPVLGGRGLSIPWSMIAPHEAQAYRNHSQTLKGLAGRGGLGWCEMLAVLEDRAWTKDEDAKAKVLALVERWKARDAGRIEAAAKVLCNRLAPHAEWGALAELERVGYRSMAKAALDAALL